MQIAKVFSTSGTGGKARLRDQSPSGYARSPDLVHWETSGGRPQPLPMTLENCEIVDPVPIDGGILNGNTLLGFDSQDRPMIAYHKFDAQGNTQIYNARRVTGLEDLSDQRLDFRRDLCGGGSIQNEINLGPVIVAGDGSLTQSYHHVRYGSGCGDSIRPRSSRSLRSRRRGRSPRFDRVESTWPGMAPRTPPTWAEATSPACVRLAPGNLASNRDPLVRPRCRRRACSVLRSFEKNLRIEWRWASTEVEPKSCGAGVSPAR